MRYWICLLAVMVFLAGCAEQPEPKQVITPLGERPPSAQTPSQPTLGIFSYGLFDHREQRGFILSELREPYAITIFGPNCPACEQRQEELEGRRYVAITLDTTMDVQEIRQRAHSTTGTYVIADETLTALLIEALGTSIVTYQSAPTVIICDGGIQPYLTRQQFLQEC